MECWLYHIDHLTMGIWADRRCKVCALKSKIHGTREQWNTPEPEGK